MDFFVRVFCDLCGKWFFVDRIIVLIGAPGAGKGTQARLLHERRGIPQISTGDIFREMKSAETPLAREVQETMAAGKLIADDLTYRIVRDRTSKPDAAGTYVLDGYPRTAVQAGQLEALAKEQSKEIRAIEINVPAEELFRRLTGRRSCPVCGEIYNIYSRPPKNGGFCDEHPEAALVRRADDNDESVRTRLGTYEANTRPLIDYYERTGRLARIDGTGEVEEIYQQLEQLL